LYLTLLQIGDTVFFRKRSASNLNCQKLGTDVVAPSAQRRLRQLQKFAKDYVVVDHVLGV
jgi:hypothetical protein